jgi:hypothetical protein
VRSSGLRTRGTLARLASGLASCTLAAIISTGCVSARSNLGTSDSSCYLSLPSASKAVGSHSRLIGVHLFTLMGLRQQVPGLFKALPAGQNLRQRVCVIGFAGTFTNTSVSKPLGLPSGRLAVVVLKTPSNQLLGTVIFSRPPLHFGHPHIG